jgi:hypothetical protein
MEVMRSALALSMLLAGCVAHERRAPPPPPPPPPPGPATASAPEASPPPPQARGLDERAAVKVAADFARARGLEVQRYKAKLDPHGHWRVDLRSERSGDRAKVLVDAHSGRVIRAKLKPSDEWKDY